jgi:hypothetical protein
MQRVVEFQRGLPQRAFRSSLSSLNIASVTLSSASEASKQMLLDFRGAVPVHASLAP